MLTERRVNPYPVIAIMVAFVKMFKKKGVEMKSNMSDMAILVPQAVVAVVVVEVCEEEVESNMSLSYCPLVMKVGTA